LLLAVAIWLAAQHKPRWYRPPVLDEQGLRRARVDAVNAADGIGDRLAERTSFEVTLTDESINQWLAAWPTTDPESYGAVPPEIQSLAVRFEQGSMRIGAQFENDGWEGIFSIVVAAGVEADPGVVTLALQQARLGSLPLPKSAMEGLVTQVRDLYAADRPRGSTGDSLAQLRSANDLFAGIRIDNRFTWFNGKRPFVIESIDFEEGLARIRLLPGGPGANPPAVGR
jgi:hypothetical protein